MFMSLILNRYTAWRRYRQTLRELGGLNDRELSELGLVRWEIPVVARKAAAM